MSKATKKLVVNHAQGLHCRPSASFVKLASKFQSDIFVDNGEVTVNGKSIMGLLMLSAGCGTKINVTATGPDAPAAVNALEKLVNDDFIILP